MSAGAECKLGVERLEAVLDFPYEVLEYVTWLRQSAAPPADDYLFEQPAVRFEAQPGDVIVVEPGLSIEARGAQVVLSSSRTRAALELAGVPLSKARALCALFDGERCLAEVRALAQGDAPLLAALLEQAFGKMLFAPLPLFELERAISGSEIARFPGAPYEIARPYWRNMAAVRARLPELEEALADDAAFMRALRRLHVIALMGDDLQTFYRPRSRISERRAAPGQIMHLRAELAHGAGGTLFLAGPRVNAEFVGGAAYRDALLASLGLPALGAGALEGSPGADWGQIVQARAPSELAARAWFCPPRPIQPRHVTALRSALQRAGKAAAAQQGRALLAALADFHQCFVRLHPFHCANQCLAMNIVNHWLRRVLGAGIPHLMLDHLALLLPPPAYAVVFERAAAAYLENSPDIAKRYVALAGKRAEASRFLHALEAAADARAMVAESPAQARLLMLA